MFHIYYKLIIDDRQNFQTIWLSKMHVFVFPEGVWLPDLQQSVVWDHSGSQNGLGQNSLTCLGSILNIFVWLLAIWASYISKSSWLWPLFNPESLRTNGYAHFGFQYQTICLSEDTLVSRHNISAWTWPIRFTDTINPWDFDLYGNLIVQRQIDFDNMTYLISKSKCIAFIQPPNINHL